MNVVDDNDGSRNILASRKDSWLRSADEIFFECYCDSSGCLCSICDETTKACCGGKDDDDTIDVLDINDAVEKQQPIILDNPAAAVKETQSTNSNTVYREEQLINKITSLPRRIYSCLQITIDFILGFMVNNFSIIIVFIIVMIIKSLVGDVGPGMMQQKQQQQEKDSSSQVPGSSTHEQHHQQDTRLLIEMGSDTGSDMTKGGMKMEDDMTMNGQPMFRDDYLISYKPFETDSLAGPITIIAVLILFEIITLLGGKLKYLLMERPVVKSPTKNTRFWLWQEMATLHYLAGLAIVIALIVEGVYHFDNRHSNSMMAKLPTRKFWNTIARTMGKVGTDLWSIAILTSIRRFGLAFIFDQNHEFYLRFHILAGSFGIALAVLHGLVFGLIYMNCWKHLFIQLGIIATIFASITWVVATAIKPYLDGSKVLIGGYDIFRLSHHLMTGAVGLAGYHIYYADLSMCGQPTLTTIFYLTTASYAGLVYLLEFFLGYLSLYNEIRIIDDDQQHAYLRVKVNPLSFHRRKSRPLNFRPGQYAYIWIPTISLASHPFTIAWSDDPSYITFLIKKSGRFTEKLIKMAVDGRNHPMWINGPYGCGAGDCATKRVRICIAAGVGITPMPSIIAGYNDPIINEECFLFYTFRSGNLYREVRPWIKDLSSNNCTFVCTAKTESFNAEDVPLGGEDDVIIRERTNVSEWLASIKERVGGDGSDVAIFYCGPDVLKAQIWNFTLNNWSKAHLRLETFDMLSTLR